MTLREKQKKEALERMSLLHIMKEVRDDFKQNDRVYYSERQNAIFNAILYWLDNEEEYVKVVKQFEKDHKALVYHCQLTHFEFGDCLSLLYVSAYEEQWEQDKEDLKEGYAYAYVRNLDSEWNSDLGMIGVKGSQGGVLRTA